MMQNNDSETPLSGEVEIEVKNTRGLKINQKNSKFQKQMQEKAKAQKESFEFGDKADAFMEMRQNKINKGQEISKKILNSLRDTTLPKNKGSLAEQYEKDIRGELNNYIIELNNDLEEANDGMGSSLGILILTKALFEMRDKLNESMFHIEYLNKEIISLKKELLKK